MAAISSIEWTDTTWNPTTGCTKISPGCKNCYAEKVSQWLVNLRRKKYRNNFKLTLHDFELKTPYKWKKPSVIFVNSMSDLFHEKIPVSFIKKVFKVMNDTDRHTYQVLTKRAERLAQLSDQLTWSKNIWMGVSVENQNYVKRIEHLKKVPAAVRFLSIEPLLDEITDIDLNGIDWVIVGGESGKRYRPVEKEWVRILRDKCIEADVPFFFKQWGGSAKKKTGRVLDGRKWNEMPEPKDR